MFLAKNKKLLAAFKSGDRDALEAVYRQYVAGVRQFLRKGFTFRGGQGQFFFRGIQDESELDSAVQEVFRRSFEERARNSYNGINSFTNWVLAIARNMVINQFRNREIAFSQYISARDTRSHLTVMDQEITEEHSGVFYGRPALSQELQVEHTELKGLLDSFMGELTEHDRLLLVYRFAEGKGQEETAELIGSTRMKVRTSEAKLRSRLRAYMRNTGYIDHVAHKKKSDETPDDPSV